MVDGGVDESSDGLSVGESPGFGDGDGVGSVVGVDAAELSDGVVRADSVVVFSCVGFICLGFWWGWVGWACHFPVAFSVDSVLCL